MEALIPLLAVFKDPVNMVLILVIIGMGWFIKTSRAEDRQDKQKMIEVLESVRDAVNALRNALSAEHGRPL